MSLNSIFTAAASALDRVVDAAAAGTSEVCHEVGSRTQSIVEDTLRWGADRLEPVGDALHAAAGNLERTRHAVQSFAERALQWQAARLEPIADDVEAALARGRHAVGSVAERAREWSADRIEPIGDAVESALAKEQGALNAKVERALQWGADRLGPIAGAVESALAKELDGVQAKADRAIQWGADHLERVGDAVGDAIDQAERAIEPGVERALEWVADKAELAIEMTADAAIREWRHAIGSVGSKGPGEFAGGATTQEPAQPVRSSVPVADDALTRAASQGLLTADVTSQLAGLLAQAYGSTDARGPVRPPEPAQGDHTAALQPR